MVSCSINKQLKVPTLAQRVTMHLARFWRARCMLHWLSFLEELLWGWRCHCYRCDCCNFGFRRKHLAWRNATQDDSRRSCPHSRQVAHLPQTREKTRAVYVPISAIQGSPHCVVDVHGFSSYYQLLPPSAFSALPAVLDFFAPHSCQLRSAKLQKPAKLMAELTISLPLSVLQRLLPARQIAEVPDATSSCYSWFQVDNS